MHLSWLQAAAASGNVKQTVLLSTALPPASAMNSCTLHAGAHPGTVIREEMHSAGAHPGTDIGGACAQHGRSTTHRFSDFTPSVDVSSHPEPHT